jgi:hypothetical protein
VLQWSPHGASCTASEAWPRKAVKKCMAYMHGAQL